MIVLSSSFRPGEYGHESQSDWQVSVQWPAAPGAMSALPGAFDYAQLETGTDLIEPMES